MIARIIQLQIGLMLFGLGLALLLKANLGADPWTVFHVGLASKLGLSIGTIVQLTGACFMFTSWLLLREPIGFGSACNMLLVGPWLNFFLAIMPSSTLWWQSACLFSCALLILGLGTALYITANFGAGPRDSVVMGVARKSRLSIKMVRLGIELVALVAGFSLGGPVGVGTVIFALAMGPIMQFFLDRVRVFMPPITEKSK